MSDDVCARLGATDAELLRRHDAAWIRRRAEQVESTVERLHSEGHFKKQDEAAQMSNILHVLLMAHLATIVGE